MGPARPERREQPVQMDRIGGQGGLREVARRLDRLGTGGKIRCTIFVACETRYFTSQSRRRPLFSQILCIDAMMLHKMSHFLESRTMNCAKHARRRSYLLDFSEIPDCCRRYLRLRLVSSSRGEIRRPHPCPPPTPQAAATSSQNHRSHAPRGRLSLHQETSGGDAADSILLMGNNSSVAVPDGTSQRNKHINPRTWLVKIFAWSRDFYRMLPSVPNQPVRRLGGTKRVAALISIGSSLH